ncbi:nucleotidyltransferase family protein [Aestuariibius sp. 2305UL40-4]|uniref:nucleotidyltransferase family protein n=1 Tax=Aestuariibius violaceus TaxID=3234132 RepID=UPI00345ECC88
MTKPRSAMVFAAGFGTRMGALTEHSPKAMIEVAGRPLIDHAIDPILSAEIPNVIANLHYRPDVLRLHLEGRGITTITEHPEILETGGGLLNALPLLGPDPVLTMNSDAVWHGPNPIGPLCSAWDPDQMDALLLLVPRDRAHGHAGKGSFTLDTENRISWHPDLVYTGLQILRTDTLAAVGKSAFSLREVWQPMIEAGRVHGLIYDGHWCDVGRPAGIAEAEAMLAAG